MSSGFPSPDRSPRAVYLSLYGGQSLYTDRLPAQRQVTLPPGRGCPHAAPCHGRISDRESTLSPKASRLADRGGPGERRSHNPSTHMLYQCIPILCFWRTSSHQLQGTSSQSAEAIVNGIAVTAVAVSWPATTVYWM